ncbi:MAG: DinB family protein [Longimicrobiales bacterium]
MSVFTNPASASVEHARAYTDAILGLLGSSDPLQALRATAESLRRSIDGMSEEAMSVPEAPDKWSIRHVLRHLADSDLVWAWRLRMVLAQDRPPLIGYDQDAWAARLRYQDAPAHESLEEFAIVRRGNLRLLEHAAPADLDRVGVHAERGEESLKHMMRLYAGHDLLHLRQIDRIREAVL